MLLPIKTHPLRCVVPMVSVAPGLDAIELHLLACSTTRADASQHLDQLPAFLPRPFFLHLAHRSESQLRLAVVSGRADKVRRSFHHLRCDQRREVKQTPRAKLGLDEV